MCEFLSAIILKDGTVVCNPIVDSHSLLIAAYKDKHPSLASDNPTNSDRAKFIRVEFSPPKHEYDCPELYKLKIDETFRPGWFDEDMEAQTVSRLQDIVSRMVVSCNGQTVIEGCWIVIKGKQQLNLAAGARAFALGNSTVKALGNSTVKAWGNSTVEAWGNSTVEAWDNSTVEAWDNSTVKAWDNSTVKALGNSTVKASTDPYDKPIITDTRKPTTVST